jgi:hypothetical protein
VEELEEVGIEAIGGPDDVGVHDFDAIQNIQVDPEVNIINDNIIL